MASSQENPHHVRSISLPTGSHPLAQSFEEELQKMKTWAAVSSLQPTSLVLCNGLNGLASLYNCVENLLRMQQAQQTLSQLRHEKWVAEELDASVTLMDTCESTRESLSGIKEQAQGLQASLRTRRLGDRTVEGKVQSYMVSRSKASKQMKQCLKTLKQMDDRCAQDLALVVSALREVRAMTIIVYRSIFSFFSKQKTSGWSLVSKAMRRGKVACEEDTFSSEVEDVDVSLHELCKKISSKDIDAKKIQKVQNQLKGLEVGIDGVEMGLHLIFQRQIQTRVSLLNIFSP